MSATKKRTLGKIQVLAFLGVACALGVLNYPSSASHGRGHINVATANSTPLSGWPDDELYHMHIGADEAKGTWSLALDERAPDLGVGQASNGDVQSVRMDFGQWRALTPDDASVQVAIDNIVAGTMVPEPSSCGLCAMTCGLLFFLRRDRGHRLRVEPGAFSELIE